MAENKTKRLSPAVLLEDLAALDALEAIPDWTPSNSSYSKANAVRLRSVMVGKQTKENQDNAQAKASRDDAVISERELHDFVIETRLQGKAQYGANSNEVQSLGLKKKSEYKRKSNPKPPSD